MVRTKADGGACSRKVVAAQAPRKNLGGAGSSSADGSSPSGKNKYAGGNAVCPRPTPDWQKGITSFFNKNQSSSASATKSSSSSSSSTSSSQEHNENGSGSSASDD